MGFGMTTNEIQLEFTRILTHLHRSFYHLGRKTANLMLVEFFQLDEIKTELGWDRFQAM
jgi:hypothetical protein